MDSELIKNRLLKRRQSSEVLVERITPPVIEQGTKIFVVGPPRSGTTLIYSLIAGESFLPECTFVSTLMKVFHETYRFSDEERFEYYGHTLANLVELFKKPIYDFLYTAALRVSETSANRFIYKDPMLTLYLDYFPLFFDDSYKIVFCVRDPRDVVASMFNVMKKKNSEADTDVLFEESMDFIWPFYRTIYELDETLVNVDKNKLIFIKYEQLVAGNMEVMHNLENFLGLTINPQSVNRNMKARLDEASPFYSENYGKPITSQPIGRYKDSLTLEQITRVEHVFSHYMNRLSYERIGEPGFSQLVPRKNLTQVSSLQIELQKSQQKASTLQQELQKSQQKASTLQQNMSNVELELQKLRSEVDSLYWVLARMPLALEEPTIEKTEQSIWFLNDYYRSREHPNTILLFENIIKINAHLVAANLYLREGRYRSALSHLVQIGKKDPLIFFSLQTIKILVNGLLFRPKKPGRA